MARKMSEWLRHFYRRFDNDVRILLSQEPLWKACHSCHDGYCCRKEEIPVMGEEWNLVTDYVRRELSKRSKDRFLANIESERIQCPFLFGHRCAVYPVRPWACRIFPYTISFYRSPITFQSGGIFLPYCPTLAPLFGVKQDDKLYCQPEVVERFENGRLVKCQLEKLGLLWLIDISEYFREYEERLPKNEWGTLDGDRMHNWVGLPKLLRDTGVIDEGKFRGSLGLD